MANPWFRFYSEFMSDPKVQLLTEFNQRRLVMLFCMRCNGDVTLQDKHVTFVLRISDIEWQQTKAEFIANGFIDSDNNLLNWEKRQYISDTSKHRVAKHRALHKKDDVTPCNVTVTPPDTEQNRTDTDKSLVPSKLADDCPYQLILDSYHEILPEMPRVKILTEKRKKFLKGRWREDEKRQDIEFWRRFFNYVRTSDFLMGKTQTGWQADFEWLVNSSNFVKVIEGKYDNRKS